MTVVLYDRDCGFCRWTLDKLLAWDRARRLRPVPIQSGEGERLLEGVDASARLDSWHAVGEDGVVVSGGAAAVPVLRSLPGGRPLAAVLAAFPGTTERGYRYVARRRDRWARLLRIDPSCGLRR